jgi:hypothetical protein
MINLFPRESVDWSFVVLMVFAITAGFVCGSALVISTTSSPYVMGASTVPLTSSSFAKTVTVPKLRRTLPEKPLTIKPMRRYMVTLSPRDARSIGRKSLSPNRDGGLNGSTRMVEVVRHG